VTAGPHAGTGASPPGPPADSSPPTSDAVPLPAGLLPAQAAVCRDLLAWGRPRPAFEPDLASRLRRRLEERVLPVLADHGESVFLSKSRLRALDCDGRWLDRLESAFEWSTPLVAGSMVHRAIELDTATGRARDPAELVDRVVAEMTALPSGEGAHLAGMDTIALHDLQAACRHRVVEWRELWPLLDGVHSRFEQTLRCTLDRGGLVVQGKPDLVVTSTVPRPDVATAIIVDIKTGRRNETAERADLRLYALLWTLKYRQPPFRWATYYLAEGRWDVEDFDPALLEATIERLGRAVEGVARLSPPPPDEELRLHPGGHCTFCGRRPECPVAPER